MGVCEWPECGNEVEGRARFCGATCRSRAARDRRAAAAAVVADETPDPDVPGREHKLVSEVRRELSEAGALDTVDGQIALQIARRVVDAGVSGVAALSKELRAVLAEAKSAGKPAGGDGPDDDDDGVEDEVARARRVREEAREAAGLS